MQTIGICIAVIPLLWIYALILARWERGLYWLVAYLPFAGAVSLALHLWSVSLLFKDILFVVPLYLAFFGRVAIHRVSLAHFPPSIAYLMLGLAVMTVLQAGNPAAANALVGLIGLKVWLLYLPLCFVAYAFVDSAEKILRLLRLMVILSFIPAAIGLLQLGMVGHFGYESAMQMSYGEVASPVTQNFSHFSLDQGSFGRIPSIFTFVTQFLGYSLAMIPPSYILSRADPSPRWRRIGTSGANGRFLGHIYHGRARRLCFYSSYTGSCVFPGPRTVWSRRGIGPSGSSHLDSRYRLCRHRILDDVWLDKLAVQHLRRQ